MKQFLITLLLTSVITGTVEGQSAWPEDRRWNLQINVGSAFGLTTFKSGAPTDALIDYDNDHLQWQIFRLNYRISDKFGLLLNVQASSFEALPNRQRRLESILQSRFGDEFFIEPFLIGSPLSSEWNLGVNAHLGGFYLSKVGELTLLSSLQVGTSAIEARRLTVELKRRNSNLRQRIFFERSLNEQGEIRSQDSLTILASLRGLWPVSHRFTIDGSLQSSLIWSNLAYQEIVVDLLSDSSTTTTYDYPDRIANLSVAIGLGYFF